jgi:hypothetical protein
MAASGAPTTSKVACAEAVAVAKSKAKTTPTVLIVSLLSLNRTHLTPDITRRPARLKLMTGSLSRPNAK